MIQSLSSDTPKITHVGLTPKSLDVKSGEAFATAKDVTLFMVKWI